MPTKIIPNQAYLIFSAELSVIQEIIKCNEKSYDIERTAPIVAGRRSDMKYNTTKYNESSIDV